MLKAHEQLHFSNYKNRFRCVIFIDGEKANFLLLAAAPLANCKQKS
jgi:hypothetical protein